MKSIRILIADDHALIRDGLKKILNIETGLEITVVGEAANGREAVLSAQKLNPDIILMDINMPELNGIEA
ncbi:MAG: response regulator, partial [Firmicutes bacterium]|nr:response regulator [Bacillota bacterium]